MKINITHNKTVIIKKTNTMDGFTKYVPPHMRKRNRKNKNKKNKNVENNVNLNDHTQFPQLVSESEPVIDNVDWAVNAKENYTHSYDMEEEEYFNIGNITFKQDAQVRDGWIILNKDSNKNRGNYKTLDFTCNEEMEWYYKSINYFNLVDSMERNPSNGILLFPKYCIDSPYYDDEDDDDDYTYEEEPMYNEDSDYEEVVDQENIIYDDSDYNSDY